MKYSSQRWIWLLLSLFSFGVVGVALVSQHYYEMMPCAWCIFQRMIFLFLGGWSLLAFLINPKRLFGYLVALVAALTSIGGMVSALYQHFVAAQAATCDLTLADRIVTSSGLDERYPDIFAVWGSCADAAVTVLGVQYDIWAAMGFVFTLALSLMILAKKTVNPQR